MQINNNEYHQSVGVELADGWLSVGFEPETTTTRKPTATAMMIVVKQVANHIHKLQTAMANTAMVKVDRQLHGEYGITSMDEGNGWNITWRMGARLQEQTGVG